MTDAVTVELIGARLISYVREMSELLRRATYSPLIREILDFSNGLHDSRGEVVAQAAGIPGLYGLMSTTLQTSVDAIGRDNLRPGDVVICNDPYLAGNMHLNDINVLAPIFHDGELVMFALSKAHWADVGSKDAGGWSADATSIFQEGVRIPPLKLVSEGKWNDEVVAMIEANSRLPEPVHGDLAAQMAAMRVGQQRVGELYDRYGRETVDASLEAILNHGEVTMRTKLESIPDGEYAYEDFGDDDGAGNPVRIVVKLVVSGGELTVDFDGTDPQSNFSMGNMVYAALESMVRLSLKCMLDPTTPYNEGSFRPISIVAPEGSCVNAKYPAPVTVGVASVGHAATEAVIKVLGKLVPERAIADQYGCVQVLVLSGEDRHGGTFIHFMPYAGGAGARHDKDGVNAIITLSDGDIRNIPVEVIETNFPLQVDRYELVADSGGIGRYRGGVGVRTDYRVLGSGGVVGSTALNRTTQPPEGLEGGSSPDVCRTWINPGTPQARSMFYGNFEVGEGEVVSHQMAGGGGFGDPLERDPEAVAEDVREGYVSAVAARERYGVVLGADGTPDNLATEQERSRQLAAEPG